MGKCCDEPRGKVPPANEEMDATQPPIPIEHGKRTPTYCKTEQEFIKEVKEANHKKKPRHVSYPTHLLTQEQARQFLRAAQSDPLEALYILALTTGMRWGDLLTLTWEDVDLTYGKLQVSGTVPQREQ